MNLNGAYELFTCTCCGAKFWSQRSAVHNTLCDSLSLKPCNLFTPGAIWCPIGPCCSEAVLDMTNSLPPPETDAARWAM